MTAPKHLPVLDHLRGLAAVSVCLFHFSNSNPDFLPTADPLKAIGSFGHLGVHAFFVISGFVIPYSMFLRSYRIKDCLGFFLRRLKRLEPPYVSCIALILLLQYLSSLAPSLGGREFNWNWPQLLAHFGYLNAVLGLGWLNNVFWTLAIEFQYYLFMALAFPLLVHDRWFIRVFAVIAFSLLGFCAQKGTGLVLLPLYLPLFGIGMTSFQCYVGKLTIPGCAVLLAVISAVCFCVLGAHVTFVGLLTAVCILVAAHRKLPEIFAPLAFLGTISYSLYLLHGPIGGRVITISSRLPESVPFRYLAIVIAFAISVAFSYAFWWCIERPSQHWAKSPATLLGRRKATLPSHQAFPNAQKVPVGEERVSP